MRTQMRSTVGSITVVVIAFVSAMVLALTGTMQAAITLAANTALVVPGTGTSNPDASTNYLKNAVNNYVNPSWSAIDPCTSDVDCAVGVPYTAQFWPFPFAGWGGLEGAKWNDSVQNGVVSLSSLYGEAQAAAGPGDEVVIFGYSQGATVASIVKRQLANPPEGMPGLPDNVRFVLIGNPNRPNGGLFERLAMFGTVPILDATFGQPTPTNTSPTVNTTDIAFQYDGVADFPAVPWNLLAVLNAALGFEYVHGTYLDPRGRPEPEGELPYGYDAADIEGAIAACQADPSGANCQRHGDTVYVTLAATSLPLFQPFIDLGSSTGTSWLINPVVALLQPLTQTLIETAYIRDDYGRPTPFTLIPRVNLVKLVVDLINDIPEGINAAIATINDPNHKIPDLPRMWGDESDPADTLTVTARAQNDGTGTTEIPDPQTTVVGDPQDDTTTAAKSIVALPTLPALKLPKLVSVKKSEDDSVTPGADADADTPQSDVQPVRDLAKVARRVLGPPPKAVETAIKKAADRAAARTERAQSRFGAKKAAASETADKPAADKPAA
ncbi:hypothetical protein A5727_14835 [Mycobacterium sp. ACS4331]|nr:hypothetical protein A5727_14835 [Mycobacterium sp. ACS4331]